MRDDLPEVLENQVIAFSDFYQLERLSIRFRNGVERRYERLVSKRHAAVMVAAITPENEVILVEEYAAGVHRYELTLPKGVMEPGEDIILAAEREMREEIGSSAQRFDFIKTFTTNPGYMDSCIHLVLAQGLYPSPLEGDEPEPLIQTKWPINNLLPLVEKDNLTEARTIAALFLLREYLNQA